MGIARPTTGSRPAIALCTAIAVSAFDPGAGTAKSADPPLRLTREQTLLRITGPHLPGGEIAINYLEAYCRAGSTDADWKETVIGHRSHVLEASDDGTFLAVRDDVADGLVVHHEIRSTGDAVRFDITARNPTSRRSEAHWAQPCIRLAKFTGADQQTYLGKSFVFLDGGLARMPTRDWATEARYVPGQVWCPAGVDRNDVNPRPLSPLVPSNGLIGCFSTDERRVFGVAFEPYQELFQGVAVCLHADFRLGGLDAGETRRIRGRIYVVPDVATLLERYHRDFPEHASSTAAP